MVKRVLYRTGGWSHFVAGRPVAMIMVIDIIMPSCEKTGAVSSITTLRRIGLTVLPGEGSPEGNEDLLGSSQA